jgi:hypothetical protein
MILDSILENVKLFDVEKSEEKWRRAEQARDQTPKQQINTQWDFGLGGTYSEKPESIEKSNKTFGKTGLVPTKEEIAKFISENQLGE